MPRAHAARLCSALTMRAHAKRSLLRAHAARSRCALMLIDPVQAACRQRAGSVQARAGNPIWRAGNPNAVFETMRILVRGRAGFPPK